MPTQATGHKRWAGTTYGSDGMHRALVWVLRWVDVRCVYVFAALFVVPFCLLAPGARTTYRYLRQRCAFSPMQSLWGTYRNHCLFGQVVIDRFAMYAGKRFEVSVEGYDEFLCRARRPEGFIQLSAHVGNYELAGYTLVAEDKPMNALVFGGEKASVMRERSVMFGTSRIKMIPVMEDMTHLFAINNALGEGEIVSFPADRQFGAPRTTSVDFMGALAHIPVGPFQTAVMRGCDVLCVNVMKSGMRAYTIYVTPLDYDRTLPKRQQIDTLAQGYAKELERRLRQYPHQWYNYYNFWTL